MGGEFGYNPERETNPENGKDLEIEVKIINLGNPNLLIKKILDQQGTLEKEKRRIYSSYFDIQESYRNLSDFKQTLDVNKIQDLQNLEKAIELLGFKILKKSDNSWQVERNGTPKQRTIRIRTDDGNTTLTIKTPRVEEATHDERVEINTQIEKEEDALELLASLGYQQKGKNEKDRITFMFNNCLVEINYGPIGKPWGEIEGKSKEDIFETARMLGYAESDLASMSDGQYYKKIGATREQVRNMTFANFKKKKKNIHG